jgi:hypothetical protein
VALPAQAPRRILAAIVTRLGFDSYLFHVFLSTIRALPGA